jgi:UDPglucose 6-dehydrogenase
MDINAPDFIERFSLDDATVGIIGQGFVGSAIKAYFERKVKVIAFDKYKKQFNTLEEVVKSADIIFVCVPTPMKEKTGECFTGIVESALDDINFTARTLGRPLDSFVVIVKSTVPPGFTDSQKKSRPGMRIVFSPEFLTEKNSFNDMLFADRVVVGGDKADAIVVLRFFLGVDNERVQEGKCVLVQCEAAAAEMSKLYTNGILFTKVLFSNEIYALCEKLGINYQEVRAVSTLDKRIGGSHTGVPGHDGQLGAGGHCFPKDMYNLKFVASQLGVPEKIFTAVLDRNDEVREIKDWLDMPGRAVVKE